MSRLNNLEDVYNTLVALDFNFSTLPSTSKYYKYYLYKTDPDVRALPEASHQEQGRRKKVGIRPFGETFNDSSKYIVKVSGRAYTEIDTGTGYGGMGSVYGVVTALDDYTKRAGFVPAKAIFAKRLTTPESVTAAENRLTGRAYKRHTGETFTFPFGRAAATDEELEVQDEIVAQVEETHVVSFKPERVKRNK